MRRPGILFLLIVMVACVGVVGATIVDISVATDKEIYQLNEEVTVLVTAYNPNPEPVTLRFGSTLVASYLMDDAYYWHENRNFAPVLLRKDIEPNSRFTWELAHGSKDMDLHALDLGVHSVVGEVVGYGQSEVVNFEVIPEPATIVILGFGVFWVRKKRGMPK